MRAIFHAKGGDGFALDVRPVVPTAVDQLLLLIRSTVRRRVPAFRRSCRAATHKVLRKHGWQRWAGHYESWDRGELFQRYLRGEHVPLPAWRIWPRRGRIG